MSAIVDNIPVMFAVLSMEPNVSLPVGQWLLVTLTAGVGGSLLSIGSAAGVALMGQDRANTPSSSVTEMDAGDRGRLCSEHRSAFLKINAGMRPGSTGCAAWRINNPQRSMTHNSPALLIYFRPDPRVSGPMSDFPQRAEELVEAGRYLYGRDMVPADQWQLLGQAQRRYFRSDGFRSSRAGSRPPISCASTPTGRSLDGRQPSA